MNDRYHIIRVLEKDKLGGVYLAQTHHEHTEVTLRCIEGPAASGAPWKESFQKFTQSLLSLQHKHLLKVVDAYIDGSDAIFVTERLQSKSLAEIIEQTPLSELETQSMAAQLLEALQAVHSAGMVHGAMHTKSIYRHTLEQGQHHYYFADLGLEHLAALVQGEATLCGDPVITPPEKNINQSSYDQDHPSGAPADLFMLSQLCFTAMAGGHPFAEMSRQQCVEKYLIDASPPLQNYAPDASPGFAKWLRHLGASTPSQRPASARLALYSLRRLSKAKAETIMSVAPTLSTEIPFTNTGLSQTASTAQKKKASKYLLSFVLMSTLAILVALGIAFRPQNETAPNAASVLAKKQQRNAQSRPPNSEPIPASAGQPQRKLQAAGTQPICIFTQQETQILNLIKNRRKPTVIEIEQGHTLDWTITTGVPASSKRIKKNGGQFIQSISALHRATEFALTRHPLRILVNDKKVIPRATINHRKGAQVNDGWEVMLRAPAHHQGAVEVHFLLTQWHCDVAIEITELSTQKTHQFLVPAKQPAAIDIPIHFSAPKASEFYSCKIQAVSRHPKDGFSLGLNAIRIEQIK